MSYKWRPSKSQRQAFAQKMQDPDERAIYEANKAEKARKKREKSKFDYNTAGGNYVPTHEQYIAAVGLIQNNPTQEQKEACEQIFYGYSCNQSISHDHIHIINEYRRAS